MIAPIINASYIGMPILCGDGVEHIVYPRVNNVTADLDEHIVYPRVNNVTADLDEQ